VALGGSFSCISVPRRKDLLLRNLGDGGFTGAHYRVRFVWRPSKGDLRGPGRGQLDCQVDSRRGPANRARTFPAHGKEHRFVKLRVDTRAQSQGKGISPQILSRRRISGRTAGRLSRPRGHRSAAGFCFVPTKIFFFFFKNTKMGKRMIKGHRGPMGDGGATLFYLSL